VICAHGARGGSAAAAAHARVLAGRGVFASVRACALLGAPSLDETLAALADEAVLLLPFLMADGYTARRVLPRRLAEAGIAPTVRPPLGTHPGLASVIAAAARAHGAGRESALLLIGHGSGRDPASTGTARAHAARLAASGAFAAVATAFLDAPPGIAEALAGLGARPVVAVGLFADAGTHGDDDAPRRLAAARPDALYAGAIGPRPEIADLILAHATGAPWPATQAAEPPVAPCRTL